jgi:PHD/YefM family antitoxin component YafN of YafNO toxin-antitoxin module
MEQVQYISNKNSKVTGVIVPIDLWREIESERETARLLRSETMKRRLLEAKNRKEGIPLNDVCTQLGI